MANFFYLFGLFQIIYESYYFIKNLKCKNEIDVIENYHINEFKLPEKTKDAFVNSRWWNILYPVLHVMWMFCGLWMPEKYLFVLLLLCDMGVTLLCAFKVISLSSNALKINEFILILIMAFISYLHYF